MDGAGELERESQGNSEDKVNGKGRVMKEQGASLKTKIKREKNVAKFVSKILLSYTITLNSKIINTDGFVTHFTKSSSTRNDMRREYFLMETIGRKILGMSNKKSKQHFPPGH